MNIHIVTKYQRQGGLWSLSPEARSAKSRNLQGWFLWGCEARIRSRPSSLADSGHLLPVALHIIFPVLACVQISSFYKNIGHIG